MIYTPRPLIIAIDGHSSTGKSSFARAIAGELGYIYIDSGAMYRAITLFAIRNKIIIDEYVDEEELKQQLDSIEIMFTKNARTGRNDMFLNNENVEEEIRGIQVSEKVSFISKIAFVRKKMVAFQRKMGEKKGVVMDGRDIGTVVFPDADIKIFMTADPLIRAERRFRELIENGVSTSLQEVEHNILERDFIDQNRSESPLRKADDAVTLDNSYMSQEEQMEWFKNLLQQKFKPAHS
ncbi:MAG: (d)CMP kinase [Bacteroidales bacterium]|nr:(d)CMP kinase [Bacteroidales bacterium]MCB8998656.1 (d)CMP kinase [Bacteroidales bacterium]MCB9012476.1 (d)CMP kinase [Bacteroidales bacterium]